MKSILGRVALLLLLPFIVWAGEVSAKLNQTIIYKGDRATLTLTGEGKSVKFPSIDKIAGYRVLSTSSQQSTTIINGDYKQSISKSYVFMPQESIVIPTYTLNVDGEEILTPPLSLRVTKPSVASKDADTQLIMRVDKKSAYVGEPIKLKLTFKRLPNVHYDKVELSEPEFKKFWTKKLPNISQGQEGDYITQSYTYVLFPQEEGNLTIDAPFAQLGQVVQSRGRGIFNDPFFGGREMRWRKLYANNLTLDIKPLPNGLEMYGDYEIKAHIDRERVKANKPVNLTLEVKGIGNLEDIKKFELNLDKAVVYSDEPKVFNSGPTRGVFQQKIAIVSDRNFTIPSFEFSFFDAKTKTSKTIKTKPIDIEVEGSTMVATAKASVIEQKVYPSAEPKSQSVASQEETPKVEESLSSGQKWLWYGLGLLSGLLLSLLAFLFKNRESSHRKKERPLVQQVKRAKTERELFELLLPYRNEDRELKEILDALEKNIYASGEEKIDRDLVLEILEDIL